MAGQESHGIGQRRRNPPTPAPRPVEGLQQQPKHQRQPDADPQNGKLQGRVAGQIAGQRKYAAGQKGRQGSPRQRPHQQIGEKARQDDLQERLDLEEIETRRVAAEGSRNP